MNGVKHPTKPELGITLPGQDLFMCNKIQNPFSGRKAPCNLALANLAIPTRSHIAFLTRLPPGLLTIPPTCQACRCLKGLAVSVPSAWKARPQPLHMLSTMWSFRHQLILHLKDPSPTQLLYYIILFISSHMVFVPGTPKATSSDSVIHWKESQGTSSCYIYSCGLLWWTDMH